MKLKCPECKGHFTVYIFKSNSYRCRKCGHQWDREKKILKKYQVKKKGEPGE